MARKEALERAINYLTAHAENIRECHSPIVGFDDGEAVYGDLEDEEGLEWYEEVMNLVVDLQNVSASLDCCDIDIAPHPERHYNSRSKDDEECRKNWEKWRKDHPEYYDES